MQVLMAMLYDGLAQRFHCEKGTCYDADAVMLRALHAPVSQAERHEQCAYFISGTTEVRDIPSTVPRENLVVVSQDLSLDYPCALFIRENMSTDAAVNAASEVIHDYQQWSQRLYDLMLSGADYFELVEHAHELLGNPITVIDQTLRTLAYSRNDIMNDALWIPERYPDSIDYSEAGEEDIRFFLNELKEKRALHHFVITDGNNISACLACLSDRDMVGICLVHKNREISEGDFACLQYFGQIMGLAIQTRHTSWTESIGGYDALIRDAIEGRISDKAVLTRRAALLGVTLSDDFEVIVIRPHRGFFSDAQIEQVKSQLRQNPRAGYMITYQRDIVIVVSYEQDRLPLPEDFKDFRHQIAVSKLIAGISDRSTNPLDLNMLYQEAKDAVLIGQHIFEDEAVVKYEKCRRYYLYEASYQRGDWERYIHPALYQLLELDRESSSELFATLKCLVRNGGSKSKTAKELFIQRNTLQYRLDKIEKHCDIDLSDIATLNHLYTSFELYEYCAAN